MTITRDEWNTYSEDQKFQYVELLERESSELDSLLGILPGCPRHGKHCIPHALSWIKQVLQYFADNQPDSVFLLDPFPDAPVGTSIFGGSSDPSQRWFKRGGTVTNREANNG